MFSENFPVEQPLRMGNSKRNIRKFRSGISKLRKFQQASCIEFAYITEMQWSYIEETWGDLVFFFAYTRNKSEEKITFQGCLYSVA